MNLLDWVRTMDKYKFDRNATRESASNIVVPADARIVTGRMKEPLYLFTCQGCGENIGHGHLLTDCLTVMRRRVESLETRILNHARGRPWHRCATRHR